MKTIMSTKNKYDLIHNLFFSEAEAHRLKRSRVSINTRSWKWEAVTRKPQQRKSSSNGSMPPPMGLPRSSRRYRKGRLLGKVCMLHVIAACSCFERALPQGGFARVYELTDIESGEVFAGKIVQKSSLSKARAKAKVTTLDCVLV